MEIKHRNILTSGTTRNINVNAMEKLKNINVTKEQNQNLILI
jgi:hypothetical protein